MWRVCGSTMSFLIKSWHRRGVFVSCRGVLGALFIDVKDATWDGEDKGLVAALKQRMGNDDLEILIKLPPEKYVEEHMPYDSENLKKLMDLKNTRRYVWADDPTERQLKWQMIELMQAAIFATQYRMKHLQKIVNKYSTDINFRVSFIFNRVDTLLREMRTLYTVMVNADDKKTIHDNLLYYTYILKKNVDINYIHDYMIRLHSLYVSIQVKLQTHKPAEYKKNTDEANEDTTAAPAHPDAEGRGPEEQASTADIDTTTVRSKPPATTRQLHEYNDYYNK